MSRKIGLVLAVIITLFFTYNLLQQIFSTLKQADKLGQATDLLRNLELKNESLKKKLTEVKSPAFIEQQARDKLGLAKPGETVIVITPEQLGTVLSAKQEEQQLKKLPNPQGWLHLFWP